MAEAKNEGCLGTVLWFAGAVVALVFIVSLFNSGEDEEEPKACSSSDAWFYAEQAVEGVLKNPDEADFHNPNGWTVENDPSVAGQYIVTGEVTATNSFNAKIKSTFKAVVRCEDGTWYTGRVTIE